METRANYVLVGGFVLALVVLAFAFIIWLANVDFQRTEKSYYLLFDESVSGLSVGGTVSYRGIRVGRITDIAINPDNVEQVRVDLAIDSRCWRRRTRPPLPACWRTWRRCPRRWPTRTPACRG
jgi:phospholipid/cholesterol/gamma-HCH transport system substrate-binding protein